MPPIPPTPGPSGTAPPKVTAVRKRWPLVAGALVAVVAIAVVVFLLTRGSDSTDQSATTPTTPTTVHRAQTPSSTSATPTSTSSVPSTAPVTPLAPQVFSGTGDNVLAIQHPAGSGQLIAGIGYTGTGPFTAWSAASGARDQQLVNASGFYLGRHVMGANDDQLIVSGTGPWQVTVDPVATDRGWASGAISGTGDDVVMWQGTTAGNATFHTAGPGNFIVKFNGAIVVNQVGPYDGQMAIPAGPAVVEIAANGQAWSITSG